MSLHETGEHEKLIGDVLKLIEAADQLSDEKLARAIVALIASKIATVSPQMVEAWCEAFPAVDTSKMSDDEASVLHAQANWEDMLHASPLFPPKQPGGAS